MVRKKYRLAKGKSVSHIHSYVDLEMTLKKETRLNLDLDNQVVLGQDCDHQWGGDWGAGAGGQRAQVMKTAGGPLFEALDRVLYGPHSHCLGKQTVSQML